MQPTFEQASVINSTGTGLIKVRAYAGTGKTTTLVKYAEARPVQSGLYVAFNKATQLDASKRFPSSVMCKTIHGLAFGKFGRKFQHKLAGDFRATDVIRWMELSYDYDFARLVIDTVKAYLVSSEVAFPTAACAPDKIVNVPAHRSGYAALMASKLWARMCDEESEVSMTHDGYLKLYQLSRPVLPYKYIMLDEYQDTNSVTADIVLRQSCTRIMVGDPYQGIYKFRGAKNVVDTLEADETHYLTESWRFGPKIAQLASKLLFEFFGERRPVVGNGPDTDLSAIDDAQPHATLCRTNAEVFYRAVGAVNRNVSIGFVGGVESYGFDLIHDVYKLSKNNTSSIRDPFIKTFDHYSAYEQFAKDSGDREAAIVLKVVATFSDAIPGLVGKIKSSALPNFKDAHCVLTTAHKSKGLEFPLVKLADDYWDLIGESGPLLKPSDLDPEEVRLIYVALTRAIHTLQVNSQLASFMTWFSMAGVGLVNTVVEAKSDFLDDIVFDDGINVPVPVAGEAAQSQLSTGELSIDSLPLDAQRNGEPPISDSGSTDHQPSDQLAGNTSEQKHVQPKAKDRLSKTVFVDTKTMSLF